MPCKKKISSQTKSGRLVNPCRYLGQHANSRLEWPYDSPGSVSPSVLLHCTIMCQHMYEKTSGTTTNSRHPAYTRVYIHVCLLAYTPGMNVMAQYVAKRIMPSYLSYFQVVRRTYRHTCMYVHTGKALFYVKLAPWSTPRARSSRVG